MNKGKAIIVWILIILLLGVIGYCGYQIVDRLNGNESSKTEEKKEETKTENKVVEKQESTGEELEKVLAEKIDNLYKGYANFNGVTSFYQNVVSGYKFEDMSEIDKIYIALNIIIANRVPDSADEKDYITELEQVYDSKNTDRGSKNVIEHIKSTQSFSYRVIDASTVDKVYYSLFHEHIKNYDISACKSSDCLKLGVSGFGLFTYFSDKQVYVYLQCCFGGVAGGNIAYNNQYTNADDYAEVYVSIGYTAPTSNGLVLYNAVKGDDTMQPYSTESDLGTVLKEHYQDFPEYKFTFKKDENDYYFYSVEKVD